MLCLISSHTTELAQWPSDTTRPLFLPRSIPPKPVEISPIFLPLPFLTCGSPLSSTHTTSSTCQNFVPGFLYFSHTRHCVGILKIAYIFYCASYENVLCMNVNQHDVNPVWKGHVNINALPLKVAVSYLKLKLAVSSLRITLSALLYSYETTFFKC